MSTKRAVDINIPPSFDFLFEVEPDVPQDPFEKFLSDSSCAGSFQKMSSDAAHRHVESLREESTERTTKFAKRFGTAPTPGRPDSEQKLEKRTRTEETIYPQAGTKVVATIDETSGEVLKVETVKL
jgi:hypothetical protein